MACPWRVRGRICARRPGSRSASFDMRTCVAATDQRARSAHGEGEPGDEAHHTPRGHPSTGCPHRPGIVDNSAAPDGTFVDKAVVRPGHRPILFDLPEGAGGTDAGPMSD